MLQHGVFTLIHGGLTPEAAERLLELYPPEPGQPHYLETPPDEGDIDDIDEEGEDDAAS